MENSDSEDELDEEELKEKHHEEALQQLEEGDEEDEGALVIDEAPVGGVEDVEDVESVLSVGSERSKESGVSVLAVTKAQQMTFMLKRTPVLKLNREESFDMFSTQHEVRTHRKVPIM